MYALCKVKVTIRITAPQPHRTRRHTTRIRHVEWSAVDIQGRRIFKDKQGSFLFFYLLNGKGFSVYLLNEEGYLVLAKGKSIYVYIFLTRLYSTDLR